MKLSESYRLALTQVAWDNSRKCCICVFHTASRAVRPPATGAGAGKTLWAAARAQRRDSARRRVPVFQKPAASPRLLRVPRSFRARGRDAPAPMKPRPVRRLGRSAAPHPPACRRGPIALRSFASCRRLRVRGCGSAGRTRRHTSRTHAIIVLNRGWKNFCAISVGTNALKITTVTSAEYCRWSMILFCNPNSAETVPKVSPDGHQQGGVIRFARAHEEVARERPYTNDLCDHLQREQSANDPNRRSKRRHPPRKNNTRKMKVHSRALPGASRNDGVTR